MASEIQKLRQRLGAERTRGRISRDLRAEIVHAAENAHALGTSYEQLSRELGVTSQTLGTWRSRQKQGEFVPVRLDAPAVPTNFVVHGPAGLRVEGLSLDDVAALWRRLS